MKKSRILVVGSTNMDLFMNVYKIPESGETVTEDGGVAYMPGGRGASAATAFAKLGQETYVSTKLGQDLHGQKLYQFFRDTGVVTSEIKVDSELPTGLSVIIREGDGTCRTISYPGANSGLTADNIEAAFATSPEALYISLELPMPVVVAAMRAAEVRGVPVFVDATPASADIALEKLPYCEVFSPNEEETEKFVGTRPMGADASLRAALALYKRVKCKYIVIKQGDRGAFIYDGKHYFMIPPVRAGRTVDTSGAGDAFGAGLVSSYLASDGDIKNAVQFGVVLGAMAITKKGTLSSLPTEAEVMDFLKNQTV